MFKGLIVLAVALSFFSAYNFTKKQERLGPLVITYRRPGLAWALLFLAVVSASVAFLVRS